MATQHVTIPKPILDFYAHPSAITSTGKYTTWFNQLPNNISELTRIIQGLVLYEYVASDFYGFTIPDDRKRETHLRSVERMLEQLLDMNDQPFSVARPVDQRLIGICHHFALLLVAILRAKGIPARYRCGFGAYFNPPYFEEHVVCEYWHALEARWVIVDPQFDAIWRQKLKIEHDILDVPRDRFIIAGDAWMQCRSGVADPAKFGIFKGNLRGLWFIAGEIIRDLAALNKMEMLPWDVWGAIPQPDQLLKDDQLVFFDRLATCTRSPDRSFIELRHFYESDKRLRVPATVFNEVLNCQQVV
ncbi:MAG: transglutaminase-like domain-containing protein [Elainellaceae cyanobacterium]